MPTVEFRTANFGIIEHSEEEYEVIEHKEILDSEEAAQEKIDELFEEQ